MVICLTVLLIPSSAATIPLVTISSTSPSVTTILVKWVSPPSEVGDIQGFALYWTGLAGQDGGSVTTTFPYHTIVGLSPATGYSIVAQVNAVLGERNSTAVQVYTLPEGKSYIGEPADSVYRFEIVATYQATWYSVNNMLYLYNYGEPADF